MIVHVCQCMGWTWDYTADNVDLPRLAQLTKYWKANPPMHRMVADYLGYAKTTGSGSGNGEFDAPAVALPSAEFEALLKQHGLPVS